MSSEHPDNPDVAQAKREAESQDAKYKGGSVKYSTIKYTFYVLEYVYYLYLNH